MTVDPRHKHTDDPRIFLPVPDPHMKSDFWKLDAVGFGRKVAHKSNAALRRARHCSAISHKRRLSAHLKAYNTWMSKVFKESGMSMLTRKDARRHKAIFGASGTGELWIGDGFTWGEA